MMIALLQSLEMEIAYRMRNSVSMNDEPG